MSTAAQLWNGAKFYGFAMFTTSFNAGVKAMDAVIGLAVGNNVSPMIPAASWQIACSVFVVSFIRSMLKYVVDHPLPDKLPEDDSPTPITVTQTKTTQTTITP